MPELPEVETSRRGIRPHILNKQVSSVEVRVSKLRWPVPDSLEYQLMGRELLAVNRRAKYLLLEFEHGTLMIHLGMSGSVRVLKEWAEPGKHDHVDISFKDKAGQVCVLRYNDPRKFGAVLWLEDVESSEQIKHLGPEPLSADFTGYYLHQQAKTRSVAIKQLIMDNKVVVGVGNIYANEALFTAGIRPTLPANKIGYARYQRLVSSIKQVLSQAIAQGGTTLKDFVGGDGKPGYFQQELQVYGRAGLACYVCGTQLEDIRMQGRSTVYCSKCQKGR
ncbi:bifunctional DNA-formamidopyrimidine glycosylase/DNA-(apurinic or apyrimidinic site) lyase [Litoribrevibacter albus]|uniref:Formamidopyrimidine-DNA glycosylase n=1 Tax=Litoribrevibacter albus TaxID=1473156 RepID=A0AA37SCQ3_9GAMM|nr:bifunctional DNA-formamidopyrimidine glycosylase/DNA-(apurinic or apyrimidinic site) lyase [Litoribrevibacter albus]GLQ33039.1 formamidopyrimidine-DNA glycosylase [Litoribrevibacter albus]